MPDQGLTPKDAKIAENVLACCQYLQRRATGLARSGKGFTIIIHGKGDAVLRAKVEIDEGSIVPGDAVM